MSEKIKPTDSLTDIIKTILSSNALALFCGAGISRNSGLPLASELTQVIVDSLPFLAGDSKKILNAAIPFEVFMDDVTNQTRGFNLLNVFSCGTPNRSHACLATLSRLGYLPFIATTNFDTLLEQAMESEGFKRGHTYTLSISETQFNDHPPVRGFFTNFFSKRPIRMYKIHGCISDYGSIRATLSNIAQKELSLKRENVLEHIFSRGRHKFVLVIGYSCSDIYDIVPYISSIKDSNKTMVFIDHTATNDIIVEDIRVKNTQNPFKSFKGVRIYMNADIFVDELCSHLAGRHAGIDSLATTRDSINWKTELLHWEKGVEAVIGSRNLICGLLMKSASEYAGAVHYFENALKDVCGVDDAAGNPAALLDRPFNLQQVSELLAEISDCEHPLPGNNDGLSYENLTLLKGLHEGSVEYFQEKFHINRSKSEALFESLNRRIVMLSCLQQLGDIHIQLGDYCKAIGFLEAAERIAKELCFKKDMDLCGKALSVARKSSGTFDARGDEFASQRTPVVENLTMGENPFLEPHSIDPPNIKSSDTINHHQFDFDSSYSNGEKNYTAGRFEIALECFNTAREIAVSLKKLRAIALADDAIGSLYTAIGEPQKSLIYHHRVLAYAEEHGEISIKARCINNIAMAYTALENYPLAIKNCKKALQVAEQNNDFALQQICLLNLGHAQYGTDLFSQATDSFEKAINLNKRVDNTLILAKCLCNLGNIALYRSEFQKARQLYDRSINASRKIGAMDMVGKSYSGIAHSLLHEEPKEAIRYFHKAEKLFQQIGYIEGLHDIFDDLSNAYHISGKKRKAKTYAKKVEILISS